MRHRPLGVGLLIVRVWQADTRALKAVLTRYLRMVVRAGGCADVESPAHVAPFALALAGSAQALPRVVDAYRSAGGLSFGEYGDDLRDRQAALNRPAFLDDLPNLWIPAMPDVHARLRDGAGARVADVGRGAGWASIGIARAFPGVVVNWTALGLLMLGEGDMGRGSTRR